IIHSISVSQGEPKVRVADVVVKGDLLVDGELSLMEGDLEIGKKYVKAIGEVKGRVTYEMEEKIPLSYIEKIYTGNIKKDKSLLIMDNIVNFIRPNLDGLWEEKNKEIKEFKMGDYIFPIKVEFIQFWGYIEQEQEKTEEEAQQEGETAMERHFQDIVFNGGEIIEKSIEKTVEGNYLILKAKVIVVEDIGKEIEFTRGETDTNE
ncbi:MAG: sporulation protein YqfD, partial [Anaerotignaceae bacterium]